MVKHQTYRVSDYILRIEELQCLDFGGGSSLKLCIITAHEIENPRDQCHVIDSVRILEESEKNTLYHIGVCFNSGRRSTTKNEDQVQFGLVIEDCIAAVSQLGNLIFYFFFKAE